MKYDFTKIMQDMICEMCGKEYVTPLCPATSAWTYPSSIKPIDKTAKICYECCHKTDQVHRYMVLPGMIPHTKDIFVECEHCHVVHKVRQFNNYEINTPVVCHKHQGGCGRRDYETVYSIYVNVKE